MKKCLTNNRRYDIIIIERKVRIMCLMEKLCGGRKIDCEFCLLKGGNCCGTSIDDIEYAFYKLDCLEPAIKSMKNKLLELREEELDKK